MSHRVAGIDVHKKVLMVVVIDSQDGDWGVKRKRFGTVSSELRLLCGFTWRKPFPIAHPKDASMIFAMPSVWCDVCWPMS